MAPQGFQTHRTAAVIADDGGEHPAVDGIQTQLVDLLPAQRLIGDFPGDDTVAQHLGKIPHPA